MAVNGHSAPQFSDKRVHFADIYKEPKVAHFSDVPRYIFYEGELHNYVVYTFTIQNRSTLLMANMMGTDTDYTVLRLFYRPFNSTTGRFGNKSVSDDSHRAKDVLRDQDKFNLNFDEDLTQVHLHSPVLYDVLDPGEYELYSIASNNEKNHPKRLETNIYLSPVGVDQYTSVDIGHFIRNFSQNIRSGIFSSGDVYHTFSLDSLNMISVAPQENV